MNRLLTPLRYITGLALSASGLLATSGALAREESSIRFDEAVAQYGPGLFPAITQMILCGGNYRVFVAYGNGTDLLFMDRQVPTQNESTYATEDGMSFQELNFYEQSVTIQSVSCKQATATTLRIAGKAHSFHSDKDFRFTIVVDTAKRSYSYEDTQPR